MNSSDTNRPDRRQPEPLEQRARALWREAGRQVDRATGERLRAARREALQQARQPDRQVVRWLVPGGALAAIALATLLAWPLPYAPSPTAGEHAAGVMPEPDNELPPDAEQADPSLYQNLDFYAWLAANDRQPATSTKP